MEKFHFLFEVHVDDVWFTVNGPVGGDASSMNTCLTYLYILPGLVYVVKRWSVDSGLSR